MTSESRSDNVLAIFGVIAIIGLVIVVTLGARWFLNDKRAKQEAMIAEIPRQNKLMAAIKETTPPDFGTIEAIIRDGIENGQSHATVKALVTKRVQAIVRGRLALAIEASDEKLAGLAKPQLAYIEFLKSYDVAMCSRYGMGGLTPLDLAAVSETRNGRDRDHAVSAAILVAAKDGETAKIRRVTRDLPQATAAAVVAQLEKNGTRRALVDKIVSPSGLQGASMQTQCDGSIAITRAISQLPPRHAANYLAVVLQANR
jgi:hypothetical protein